MALAIMQQQFTTSYAAKLSSSLYTIETRNTARICKIIDFKESKEVR